MRQDKNLKCEQHFFVYFCLSCRCEWAVRYKAHRLCRLISTVSIKLYKIDSIVYSLWLYEGNFLFFMALCGTLETDFAFPPAACPRPIWTSASTYHSCFNTPLPETDELWPCPAFGSAPQWLHQHSMEKSRSNVFHISHFTAWEDRNRHM